MFKDPQAAGDISISVYSPSHPTVYLENFGTTLFDDLIHTIPNDGGKPRICLSNPPDFVDIHLKLTASEWSTYPVRAMMLLYNTLTTNDADFI